MAVAARTQQQPRPKLLQAVLDAWAQDEQGRPYAELTPEQQAALRERLRREYRRNDYDPATRTLTVSPCASIW